MVRLGREQDWLDVISTMPSNVIWLREVRLDKDRVKGDG